MNACVHNCKLSKGFYRTCKLAWGEWEASRHRVGDFEDDESDRAEAEAETDTDTNADADTSADAETNSYEHCAAGCSISAQGGCQTDDAGKPRVESVATTRRFTSSPSPGLLIVEEDEVARGCCDKVLHVSTRTLLLHNEQMTSVMAKGSGLAARAPRDKSGADGGLAPVVDVGKGQERRGLFPVLHALVLVATFRDNRAKSVAVSMGLPESFEGISQADIPVSVVSIDDRSTVVGVRVDGTAVALAISSDPKQDVVKPLDVRALCARLGVSSEKPSGAWERLSDVCRYLDAAEKQPALTEGANIDEASVGVKPLEQGGAP